MELRRSAMVFGSYVTMSTSNSPIPHPHSPPSPPLAEPITPPDPSRTATPQHGWDTFLNQYYEQEVHSFAYEFPGTRSLYVDFEYLDRFNSDLADHLVDSPVEALAIAETALESFSIPTTQALEGTHIRIVNAPSHNHIPIRYLRSEHIGKLVTIDGLVRLATEVRPRLQVAAFECTRCGEVTFIEQGGAMFIEPYACQNSECTSKRFRLLVDQSTFVNFQKLRVQESPDNLRGGEQPQTLDITIEDDIVGMASPGAHVYITGVLRSFQRVTREGKSPIFDIVLDANYVEIRDREFVEIEITPEEEQKILELSRDPNIHKRIADSIAPSVEGHEATKEAIALQLAGGVERDLQDGTRVRGDVHILLVGDPGIAKSHILKFVTKLAPKAIYTAGRSSSASGLTAAAVKDDFGNGKWTLEAGALVLADRGICCIDEMDKMRSGDRSAIHEALAQQTVSVAKAGITTTLKSRCAVLGAANPKHGRFDPYDGIASQIAMIPTLLTRFDLIFVLRDVPDPEKDAAIIRRILNRTGESGDAASTIAPDLMLKYMAYIRQNIQPAVTDPTVNDRIENTYVTCRAHESYQDDAPMPITARWGETIVRLAEASARIRLDTEVIMEDVDRAIQLMEISIGQVGTDPETGRWDADRVELGTTRSQREQIRTLRDIIGDIARDRGGAAPISLVFTKAVEMGIDRAPAEQIVSDLLRSNELMSNAEGLRLVRS